MSRTDTETVARIAELARLDIEGAEAEALGRQFARILSQFEVLARLDVGDVEPMLNASAATTVQRDDVPRPSWPADAPLANAPAREGDFYEVPKTVGGEA